MEVNVPHLPAPLRRFRLPAILATPLLAILLVSIPAGQGPFAASERSGSAVVKGRLLAINAFHGALDPPTGSGGLVNGTPAGGVEYLATLIKQLRAAGEGSGEQVFTVAAGDLVGSSPLVSAAFHDEGA